MVLPVPPMRKIIGERKKKKENIKWRKGDMW
jgi:hypothetical protein